jgi:hypothetical protein
MKESNKNKTLIYLTKPKDGSAQVYVGQTTLTLKKRKTFHENNAKNGRQEKFYKTLREKGITEWEWIELDWCEADQANEREKHYIRIYLESPVEVLNTAHTGKRNKALYPKSETDNQKQNQINPAYLAGKKSWQNLDSDKWRQESGTIKPVINLKKNIKYRSISEAANNEKICKQTIVRSCDRGYLTPCNNLYAWIDINGNPQLTKAHENGGISKKKRVKNLITGVIYSDVKDAAEAHFISHHKVQGVCVGTHNVTKEGWVFCYLDSNNNEVLTERHIEYKKKNQINSNEWYAVYPLTTDYKTPLLIATTLKELCNTLGIPQSHALAVCRGERQHHKKYRFTVYDKDTETPRLRGLHYQNTPQKISRRVICLNDNKKFPTASDAANEMNKMGYKLQSNQIRQCCEGKLKTTGPRSKPFKFAYLDKNDQPILTPKHKESLKWRGKFKVFCPELAKTFQSVVEFCEETGVPIKRARKHLHNPQSSLKGLTLHKI